MTLSLSIYNVPRVVVMLVQGNGVAIQIISAVAAAAPQQQQQQPQPLPQQLRQHQNCKQFDACKMGPIVW